MAYLQILKLSIMKPVVWLFHFTVFLSICCCSALAGNKTFQQYFKTNKANLMDVNDEIKWQYNEIPEGSNWYFSPLTKEELLSHIQRLTKRNKIPPYFRVRKANEEGDFHFAKDYEEIKSITEDPFQYGRLYFSDKPFGDNHNGAKTQFSSHDKIYGRLEVNGGSLVEVFGMPDKKEDKPVVSLGLKLHLYYNGQLVTRNTVSQYLLLPDGAKGKASINFDVKPDPALMSSIFPLDYYPSEHVYNAPLYYLHNVNEGAMFRKPGKYTVRHIFYNTAVDAWGNEKRGMEREVIADFEYEFNEADVPAIIKAHNEATAKIKSIYFSIDKLPEVFSHPAKAEISYDKIKSILERDLPRRTILKAAIAQGTGPEWYIEKNELGLPRQKWFNRKIHIAYKYDSKCYVGTVDLIEPYSGAGGYGTLQVGYTSENDKLIDCSKIK